KSSSSRPSASRSAPGRASNSSGGMTPSSSRRRSSPDAPGGGAGARGRCSMTGAGRKTGLPTAHVLRVRQAGRSVAEVAAGWDSGPPVLRHDEASLYFRHDCKSIPDVPKPEPAKNTQPHDSEPERLWQDGEFS